MNANDPTPEMDDSPASRSRGKWIALGAVIGAALGVVTGNIAIGFAVGVGIGIVLGMRKSPDTD